MINNINFFQIFHLKEMSLSAEFFLSCSILQLTFYSISTAYNRKAGFVMLNQPIYYIGALLFGLTALLLLNEDLLINNSYISNNCIINDYLGFVTKLTICLISLLFFVVINISFRDEPIRNNFEYVVLICISVLGLLLLCSSNDLITAYLAIELQSVAFYIMAAFKKNSTYSIESGLKYFIIGSLSSAFFLFGSAILYGCLGSLNFDDFRMFSSILFQDSSALNSSDSVSTVLFSSTALVAAVKVLAAPVSLYYQSDWLDRINHICNTVILTANYVETGQNPISTFALRLVFFDSAIDYSSVFKIREGLFTEYGSTYSTLFPYELVEQVKDSDPEFMDLISPAIGDSELDVNVFNNFAEAYYQSIKSMAYLQDTYYFQFYPETLDGKGFNVTSLVYYNNTRDLDYVFSKLNRILDFDSVSLESSSLIIKNIEAAFSQATLSFIECADFTVFDTSLISIGFMLICISILIKLAVAPFHYWSLDVYEGSPNTTTVFFAVVPKIGLFVLLARLCYNAFYPIFTNNYQVYFIILSIFSIFVGSIGGLEQRKINK